MERMTDDMFVFALKAMSKIQEVQSDNLSHEGFHTATTAYNGADFLYLSLVAQFDKDYTRRQVADRQAKEMLELIKIKSERKAVAV